MISEYHYKVKQSDLDALDHMNYNRYVMLFSEARLQWLKDVGSSLEDLLEKQLGTVLLHFDTTYHKECRLGHQVHIETTLVKVGTKSFTMYQKMLRGEELCAESNATLVVMDLVKRKAIPVPKEIAEFKMNV